MAVTSSPTASLAPSYPAVRHARTVEERQPAPGAATSLVSVVVACSGQLEFTRLCVPRQVRHSRRPIELVFLDIASMDGTAEFLAGVAAAAPLRVEIVRTDAEASLADGYKLAVERTHGEHIVLLNNDTLVTEGWLEHLTTLANMVATIGMVGPMSNYAPAPQVAGPIPYRIGSKKELSALYDVTIDASTLNCDGVDQFAQEWRKQNQGQWFEVEQLGGFCVLLKREVLKAVDLFDAQSPIGFFATDALSERVRRAGFVLACCRDVFVHHFGSRLSAPPREARAAM